MPKLGIWRIKKMKKFKFGKDALFLTIFSLLTILTWVSFEVWQSATQNTIPIVTREQVLPLNAKFNKEIFDQLEQNFSFSQEELDTAHANPITEINLNENNDSQATISAENQEPQESEQPTATNSSQAASESAIVE